jgi:hypothetical protein
MMTGGDFVYMNDLLEFAQTLESAGSSTAEDVTTAVIHSMGEEVAKLAYQYAPKDTYQLANSIEVRKGPREARVVATAPHAAYVEFGTWSHNVISPKSGTYTIRPKKPGGVLRFTGKDGRTVFTKKVEHPGVKAQPFLGPANSEVLDRFVGTLANVGVMLVVDQ